MRRLAGRAIVVLLVAVGLVGGLVGWNLHGGWPPFSWPRAPRFTLPARLTLEDTVADLSATFDRAAVVAEAAGDPVRTGAIQPGAKFAPAGARRRAIVAPPPARLRFRVRVPAGARLRVGTAVARGEPPRQTGTGVRFGVVVDGREAWARTIDPLERRRDRRWFDDDVELGVTGEREVTIELATTAVAPGTPLAGVPGWSHVRVVRRETRARQRASAAAPSVLVLLVDTLRADRLGCYGARPSPTPTLDALALRGHVFEQAVSQASWTLPAVATFLTGLYPASHGLVAGVEDDGGGTDPSFLADTVPTLASEAARAGITTVGVSANPLVSRDTNLSRGFETFVESGWDPKRGDWTPASDIDRTFLAWLARNRGLRFFAWLHYMDVHEPYRPPAPYRPPPPGGIRPQVASGVIGPLALRVNHLGAPPLPAPEVGYLRALYEGDIAAWDAELGRLLGALGDLGVLDTTVVVVLSDHGEEFQDHGKLTHGVHLYDELVRVPFVVAGPGVAPGRTATQVQGIDLFPTLARRLGVPTPARLPGADALAALAPRPAFAETRYGRTPDGTRTTLLAVRTPERKLIEAPALGHVELYDLASDPGEHHDRAAAEPHADLAALLATWRAATPAAPAAEEAPGLLDKLRALGYVE